MPSTWYGGKALSRKLHSVALRCRPLQYINSYLSQRQVRNRVNSFTSLWIQTTVNTPGLYYCSSAVYLLHPRHDYKIIYTHHHVSYADDQTTWVMHMDLATTIQNSDWYYKWGMEINDQKTDFVFLSN